jgi:hypothetical protein
MHVLMTRDNEQRCAQHMLTRPKSRHATQPASVKKLGCNQKVTASFAHWSLMYMRQVSSHKSTCGMCAQMFHAIRNSFQSSTCRTFHASLSWLPLQRICAVTCMNICMCIPTSGDALAYLRCVHAAWVLLSTCNMFWLLCFSFTPPDS